MATATYYHKNRDIFTVLVDFITLFLCSCNIHSSAGWWYPQKYLYLYSFCICICICICICDIHSSAAGELMISPRVNVWVTTIIWRYNIYCSTSIQIYVVKNKRTCGCFGLSIVCGRAFSTQYISLFNQFFDQITLRNYIYSITTTKISPQVAPDWFSENISII